MRPASPNIDDRADLAAIIDSYQDETDGRLGVFLGLATKTSFDVIYENRAKEAFESASVIKLPVLYALHAAADNDKIDLNALHDLAPENRVGGSGTFHLLSSVTPSLSDLAMAMIAISDNAATNELIDVVGFEAINNAITRLDMTTTHLGRKMMEKPEIGAVETEAVNYTSPYDCARFFADIIHERTLSPAVYSQMRIPLAKQKYTMMFPRYLPFDTTIEHKTGSISSASLDTGFFPEIGNSPLVYSVFVDQLTHSADGADAIAEIGQAVGAWLENHEMNSIE